MGAQRNGRTAPSPSSPRICWRQGAIVAGADVVRDPEGAKQHLSYMPQRFGLYEDLTVDENIRFYADLFGAKKAEREKRASQLLRAAGMK